MPRFAVILPAAGRSSRFGGAEKKVFAALDGRPVWRRAADLFLLRTDVCQCIVVAAPEDRELFRVYAALGPRLQMADGGAERFDSVASALAVLAAEADYVAIHDAARPCTPLALIDAVFARAVETGAALAALPVADTLKCDDGAGRVAATVSRQGLWLAQTPQAFRRDWLVDAYARRESLGGAITDDAQLVEAAGRTVHLVAGSSSNLKITTRDDLRIAEGIVQASRAAEKALDSR
jgi:2-C-methyl-D-erythritol 4-phosphate cytidylyltransferase